MLKVYKNQLKEAGVPDKQAEAQARAQRDSFAEAFDTSVATKADIARLDTNIKADMARLEATTKADIAKLEKRMDSFESKLEALEMRLTIKLGALMVVAVGMIATLMKH